jgi:HAD superfamily hydrolase (TIGR01509 family)
MDGTLIDSEEFHWISWRDTMAKEGVAISHEEFLASFGRRNDAILPQWLGAAATPEHIERVGNAKEEMYRDLFRTKGMPPLPGVARWLQELHERGWLQAIASAAPRPNVDAILKALGAADYFQAIVSAEDVHIGKPDPEVYLVAAARAGASPDRCIVVEDAVAGIEGARRAGMRSIGVGPNWQHLAADVAVPSLGLLDPDAFDRLVASAIAS